MMFERARDFVTERPSAWQLRVRKPKDRTQHDTGLHVASFRLGTHATFRLVRILYRPRLSICCCARLHHVISERNKSEIALQREEPLQRFVIQHVVSSLIGQDCLAIFEREIELRRVCLLQLNLQSPPAFPCSNLKSESTSFPASPNSPQQHDPRHASRT